MLSSRSVESDLMSKLFVFGIENLDKVLGKSLAPGTLLVIAGHPGSGKTTLASTMCYANAVNGRKCLYISFQEHRDKLYAYMKRLGIDLESVEKSGLLLFVKFPLISKHEVVEHTINSISEVLANFKPDIIVVDSVTPLLKAVESDVAARAFIQNFFAELPRLVNGLAILIAEIPIGKESIDLGDIEFVSDIVFILKHRIEHGFLIRELEVRKARGSSIHTVQIPFTFVEKKGLVFFTPIILEEIPEIREELIKLPCKKLSSYVNSIKKGEVVYIAYPADARPANILMLLLSIAKLNNLKTLIISYRYSPKDMKTFIKNQLLRHGIDEEKIDKIINEHIVIRGLNPSSLPLTQLMMQELEIINEVKPDIVIFHGVGTYPVENTFIWKRDLLNQLLYLRSVGVAVIRMGAINELYEYNALMADTILRFYLEKINSKDAEYTLYVWRRGMEKPAILNQRDIDDCISDCIEILKNA